VDQTPAISLSHPIRLTRLAACAGCASKLGPATLAQVLRPLSDLFQAKDYPNLLVGLKAPDDAAVYRLNAEQAIIATADFFPPVVDDPYAFGAIAAANALSDVYAMGGEPIFAINLVAFPDDLPLEVMTEILRGGAEKAREAGIPIVGGHTIMDKEPKYGLAVTGLVHPDRIFTKGGAQPGDQLVLTKPLGAGVITTAQKRDQVQPADLQAAIKSMSRLNRGAAEAAKPVEPHALTDVTGFGLLGHAHEMAHLSAVNFEIAPQSLPWLAGAREYAQARIFPGGAERNEAYFGNWVRYEHELPEWEQRLLHDPQTSGGLLISIAEEKLPLLQERLGAAGEGHWVIGRAVPGDGKILVR
jgi:selenide,water dikinase